MKGLAGDVHSPSPVPSGELGNAPLPSVYLPVEYAPLRRKGLRAVRSPKLHRPLFFVARHHFRKVVTGFRTKAMPKQRNSSKDIFGHQRILA